MCSLNKRNMSNSVNNISNTENNPNNGKIPTNMSMYNCDVNNPYFLGKDYAEGKTLCPSELISSFMFKSHEIPVKNAEQKFNSNSDKDPRYYNINELRYKKTPRDYTQISCKGNKDLSKQNPCGDKSWVSHDPRLLDPRRNVLLHLDTFPANYGVLNSSVIPSGINMMKIYDKDNLNNGKNYRTYKDIDLGDITYYIDKDIQSEFFYPNFTIPSVSNGRVFKDPMDSYKPDYTREQMGGLGKYNDIQIQEDIDGKTVQTGYSNLSWIRDTNSHREDILAAQMAKINQERWMPRYT